MRRILAWLVPLCLVFVVVSKGAEWLSELWWFGALEQRALWWQLMAWRVGTFAVAAPLWGAILGFNLRLAWRHALAQRAPLSLLGGALGSIELELSPSLRVGRALARLSVWGAAWLAGLAAANRFDLWLLALRGGGASETQAGLNLGFFLFRLPALDWAWGWLGVALGLTFTACLCLYLWLDTIETGPGLLRASAFARAHLSALGAALIAWKGGDCALNVVGAPVVFGWTPNGILGFPEQVAGVPSNQFFAWSALPLAALVLWCGQSDRGRSALFAATGWGALALLVPALAPAFVRSLGLMDEARQRQAVASHLDATRRAWGFDRVQDVPVAGNDAFTPTQLGTSPNATAENATAENGTAENGTAENGASMDLWPLDAALAAFENRLDASARSAAARGAPALDAVRVHVARGSDGLRLRAIATRRGASGEAAALQLEAPATASGPLRVQLQPLDDVLLSEASLPPPLNRLGPAPDTVPAPPVYRLTRQSRHAVERSSPGACLVLGARFFDAALLRPGLPLSWHLEPVERAQTLAPFVNWSGAVARPVVRESGVGPHVYWLVEGCLTSRSFPGAATQPTGDAWGGVNYARQSVLAVFDGTSGQSQLFLTAPDEPLARAWARALPALWTPLSQLPPDLRTALQPSPALLGALATVYASYHPQSGDQVMEWQTRASQWRPILPGDTSNASWRGALLPDPNNGKAWWQLCAFAPARGTLATGAAPVALTALVGVALDSDGRTRWQQWRPQSPLPLPELAAEPTVTFNREGRPSVPPPTRIGLFPAFDAQNRANGFTLFRAEVVPPELTASTSATSATAPLETEPPSLRVQAVTTGTPRLVPSEAAPALGLLGRAAQLWRDILGARRAGDWQRAAQLEAQLGTTLNAPTPAVVPANAPTVAPTVAPTPRATPERAAP